TGCRDGKLRRPGPDSHGHEPAAARRLGGDAAPQGGSGDEADPDYRTHGPCHVGRPGKGAPGRVRRLRYQTHRASPAARKDRNITAAIRRTMSDPPSGTGSLPVSLGQPAHEPADAPDAAETDAAHLARIRHELRTPLNAVIGYSEML